MDWAAALSPKARHPAAGRAPHPIPQPHRRRPRGGEPLSLIEAMIQGRGRYRDLEILQMETPGPAVYARPGMEAHFRHNAVFVGEGTRDIVMAGKGDFTPIHFSQLAALFGGPLPSMWR